MNAGRRLLLILLLQVCTQAADADLKLWCLSIKFPPAERTVSGFPYRLEMTSGGDADPSNGEVFPIGSPSSHGTIYRYYDPSFPDPFEGTLYVNVPFIGDSNANRFNDFYEPEQAVPKVSTFGGYDDGVNQGNARFDWSRDSGSRTGTCVVSLDFLQGVTFTHNFELIELKGKLTYTRVGTNITSNVLLTNLADPTNLITGPLNFSLTSSNIPQAAGSWTNVAGKVLGFSDSTTLRLLGGNYVDTFIFGDFDFSTDYPDYYTWVISIHDPNDSNANGVPDFSDTSGLPPPSKPTLALKNSGASLSMLLNGTVDRLHEIQLVDSLSSTNWQTIQSVTLTQSPQAISLPLPATSTAFYRAIVR